MANEIEDIATNSYNLIQILITFAHKKHYTLPLFPGFIWKLIIQKCSFNYNIDLLARRTNSISSNYVHRVVWLILQDVAQLPISYHFSSIQILQRKIKALEKAEIVQTFNKGTWDRRYNSLQKNLTIWQGFFFFRCKILQIRFI